MTQNRTATVSRKTKETDITVTVGLDGTGKSDIQTGIGFFDHMLESFSKHSAIDLTVRCDGDLHIDMHHSVEDTGIVIGQAILKALGDFAGITRFGTAYIPMDETLSRASLDLCKRPYLVWKVQFTRDKIGEMDTELFKEFFHALAGNGGMCLHVKNLYGENCHHIAESCFKATARALRAAVTVDPRLGGQPASTKGSL
ncbi:MULTISPECIES: imidazoleglycerol-phosphate dehydratase HisB [Hyphomonas]|uniref:Imidazoleglycerol-phosphate dehydratase n=1 Tax=Hyphomonas adhaerens TaxID=81029 RepID=A0A3B9GTH3_9PROT|nr:MULTISPECIES: imidazoleglycerol-phosphate dehydratase HisB [Hyphomonas]MBB39360.1 imidazoleglycerol-phosphate dehydratase [Hyphomonas sp.]HAE25737.1 imidazoleglycerol-phosphate dehydratase HisB [Hyphomonas adhaerens]|tara:strand:- start:583 stop:1179 length:597 start_codon:yes stop_codon:yes gene_type:complete